MLLYAIFVLPEALTAKRRQELMDANEATQNYHSGNHTDDHEDEPDGRVSLFLKRINFFKKLAILLPRKDDGGKGYDYRLFILAIAFLIYRIGGLYTNDVSTDQLARCAPVSYDIPIAATSNYNGVIRVHGHAEWYSGWLHHRKQSRFRIYFSRLLA